MYELLIMSKCLQTVLYNKKYLKNEEHKQLFSVVMTS